MIYFTAHTFNCVCHSIRSMFRLLGVYNFDQSLKKLFYLFRLVILPRQHTWSTTKVTRSGSNMNTPQAFFQLKRPDFTNPNCTRLIFWRRKMMKTMRGPCKIWKRPKKAKNGQKKSKENNESNSWNDVTTSFE